MRPSGWLENVRNDCRYAVRRLRQSPGFALAAILTLVGFACGLKGKTNASGRIRTTGHETR